MYSWSQTSSYLIYSNNKEIFTNNKIAAFDLDDTIIKYVRKKKNNNVNSFELVSNNLFTIFLDLLINNYKLIIITNQSNLQNVELWKEKINLLIKFLGVPFSVFCSLKDDTFRKPRIGFWNNFINGDKQNSFYVGDAADSTCNFSDTDLKFALNLSIRFIHIDDLLLHQNFRKKKSYHNLISKFNYPNLSFETNQMEFKPNHPEVILNVGFPGSGKTHYTTKFIIKNGYEHLNLDTIKNNKELINKMIEYLKQKKSIVIDNTNVSKKIRKEYIDIINKYNIKIKCHYFDLSVENCKHNNYYRNFKSNNLIPCVPKIAYNVLKKKMEYPQMNEGFYEINKINWVNPNDLIYNMYFY